MIFEVKFVPIVSFHSLTKCLSGNSLVLRPPPLYGAVRVKVGRYIPCHIARRASVDHRLVMERGWPETRRGLRV
jgi:hypothetical protein